MGETLRLHQGCSVYPGCMIDSTAIAARFDALSPFLDKQERRLLAASEARAAGRGGIAAVLRATGIARGTIGRGLADLRAGVTQLGNGSWRKQAVETQPGLLSAALIGALAARYPEAKPLDPSNQGPV